MATLHGHRRLGISVYELCGECTCLAPALQNRTGGLQQHGRGVPYWVVFAALRTRRPVVEFVSPAHLERSTWWSVERSHPPTCACQARMPSPCNLLTKKNNGTARAAFRYRQHPTSQESRPSVVTSPGACFCEMNLYLGCDSQGFALVQAPLAQGGPCLLGTE